MGSKLCNNELESLITLDENEVAAQFVEIKIRGPTQSSEQCFYFLNNILRTIDMVIAFTPFHNHCYIVVS